MKAETEIEIEHKGYKIKIYQDFHPDSPDSWEDHEQFLIYDHRDFYVRRKGFDPLEVFEAWSRGKKFKGYFVFPAFAYIHSGIALSLGKTEYPFNDPWDVSFKGFALIKPDMMKPEKARKMAAGLIETWNAFLSGNVFGYQIEDAKGTELDSCWGFYGDGLGFGSSGIIEQAKAVVDSYRHN